MPLYKSISLDSRTQLFVWKITESYDDLVSKVELSSNCIDRLLKMRSETHRKGFVSIRCLLQRAGYIASDLYYDTFGRPHLIDGTRISITHSFDYSGIVISDRPVGIDIEQKREKIKWILERFSNLSEIEVLPDKEDSSTLTALWCAKESVYKMLSKKGLSFKNNMFVHKIKIETTGSKIFLEVRQEYSKQYFEIHTIDWKGYTCGYVLGEK